MRRLIIIFCIFLLMPGAVMAQHSDDIADVFNPISKYLARGDAESLSVWFFDNLEIDMMGKPSNYSSSQACKIMHDFFRDYPPRYFQIIHKSGSYPINCAVGNMEGGGCKFIVTILVKTSEGGNAIQQIKIERK